MTTPLLPAHAGILSLPWQAWFWPSGPYHFHIEVRLILGNGCTPPAGFANGESVEGEGLVALSGDPGDVCAAPTPMPTLPPTNTPRPTFTPTPHPCTVDYDPGTIATYLYTKLGYAANNNSAMEKSGSLFTGNLTGEPDMQVIFWIKDPITSGHRWAKVSVNGIAEPLYLDVDAAGSSITMPLELSCNTGQSTPENFYLTCADFVALVDHTNANYTAVEEQMVYQDLLPTSSNSDPNRVLVCLDTDTANPDYNEDFNARFIGSNPNAIILHVAAYYSRDYNAGVPPETFNPCATFVASVLATLGEISMEDASTCQGTGTLVDLINPTYDPASLDVSARYGPDQGDGVNNIALPNSPVVWIAEIATIEDDILIGSVMFHLDQGVRQYLGGQPHAGLVVGWGIPKGGGEWNPLDFEIYQNADAARVACSGCDPVPYVMDRGVGDSSSAMRGPRPFNSHYPYYFEICLDGGVNCLPETKDHNVTSAYRFWSK
jgi:hypothetical protein